MEAKQGIRSESKMPLWTKNFIIICIATLLFWSNSHMLMPVLPLYVVSLGIDRKLIGTINGCFTIAALFARPFVGRECDRKGRRTIYLMGLTALFIATFGYCWAHSFLFVLLLRMLHGAGWAACSTSSNTIATDLIPDERRGEGMGYFGMFTTVAMAVAPALGLRMLDTHGFKAVFSISMLMAATAILVSRALKLQKYSIDSLNSVQHALFDKRALRVSTMMFFLALPYSGIITFIALCAEERGIKNISLFFITYALAIMVSRLKVGKYYDRNGPALIIMMSMVALFVSNLLLAFAFNICLFILGGIIFGFGYGSLQPTLLALSVKGIEPERRGAVNGTVMSAFDLGVGIGSILLGVVANYGGYSAMYMTASCAPVLGILLYLKWKQITIT